MFLHYLESDTEKHAFVRLYTRMMHASGGVTADEASLGQWLLDELGIGHHTSLLERPRDHELSDVAKNVSTASARRASLLELMLLAYSDDELKPEEEQLLERLAEMWSMSGERFEQMKSWTLRFLAVSRESRQLLEAE